MAVTDRTTAASLFGADLPRVLKRERQGVPSFVACATRYVAKTATNNKDMFGTLAKLRKEEEELRAVLSKRDPGDPVPLDDSPVGHLRAFASKGKMTIELDESSEFTVTASTVATTLRQYVLALPQPLIGYENVDGLLEIGENCVGNQVNKNF